MALPIARKQTRALLFHLAAAGRPVAREQLCVLFWPDAPSVLARRNLTRLLVHLRRALPAPELLQTADDQVALPLEHIWCDTSAFMQAMAATDTLARRAQLTYAAQLARGPLLDGFTLADHPEFEHWLEGERRVWERRTRDLLRTLVELHTAARDYPAAIAAAQRYLGEDDLAEEMHRALMLLFAASGDRAAAIRQFERCAAALERELGVAPLPETQAVYAAIRAGHALPAQPELPVASPREPGQAAVFATPPAPAGALVGRAADLAALPALLARADVRLLTLIGPGGVGKTRLALELVQRIAPTYGRGAVVAPLAPLREARLVLTAIAEALGLPDQAQRPPLLRLQDALRDRELLLVLDNVEHVAAAAPELAALIAVVPGLTVLATSRTPLRLAGEQLYPVTPLGLADPALPPERFAEADAVALFVLRAQARLPGFRLSSANAGAIAAICARLDGLPLAIELAAARIALLSPQALLARLQHRLDLLIDGPRDLSDRQRTLRATIGWSYHLLDLSAQHLFEALAVFADGWHIDQAEALGATLGIAESETLRLLQALLDHQLVQRAPDAPDDTRFFMLETVREYALERLAFRGEAALVQRAHAAAFLALAERAAAELHGPRQIAWLDRLDMEAPNLRVALAWLLESELPPDALRLCVALHWYWHVRSHFVEGRDWLSRTLALAAGRPSPPPLLLAQARYAAADLAMDQGDFAQAGRDAEASVALWRPLEADPAQRPAAAKALVMALGRLCQARAVAGDQAGAQALIPEIHQRVADLGDPWYEAYNAFHNGRGVLQNLGNVPLAYERLRHAQQIFRELGDHWHLAQVLVDLGLIALMIGDLALAEERYEEARAGARRLRERALEAAAWNGLGDAARLRGDDQAAAAHYEASLRLARDLDSRLAVLRLIHHCGFLALHAGDRGLARERFIESLLGFRRLGQPRGQADALAGLAAWLACAQTDGAALQAAGLWGVAAATLAAERAPVLPADRAELERYQALARATVGASAFDAAVRAGAARPLAQAVVEALAL